MTNKLEKENKELIEALERCLNCAEMFFDDICESTQDARDNGFEVLNRSRKK